MKLHDDGLTSENINEIAAALSKAQVEVGAAIEDKKNPHFRSSYASLYSIWCACKEAVTNNGLSITQPTSIEGDILMLHTILMHSSGQWIRSKTPVSAAKMTPQAIGSAITYMRRYSLAAIVGVAPGDDDDGNAAEDKTPMPEMVPVKIKRSLKNPGFEDFIDKHDLTDPEKKEYIKSIAEKVKKTEVEVINMAMTREAGFMDGFFKWVEEKNAKIEQE